jgi:hypothetical protein
VERWKRVPIGAGVLPPLCATVRGMTACSDAVVNVLTVDAIDATELSFQHIDILLGKETQRGAHPQLCGDVRVDESLGGGEWGQCDYIGEEFGTISNTGTL